MYCKNCDKLIDEDEQVCHHCNTNPRRRKTVRARRRPLAIALGVLLTGIVLIAAWAVTFDTNTQTYYIDAEWWTWAYDEFTTMPWLEYETVTLAQLHENPEWFEGMPVRVSGIVIDVLPVLASFLIPEELEGLLVTPRLEGAIATIIDSIIFPPIHFFIPL